MTIARGDRLPQATVFIMGEAGPQPVSTNDYFAGRKVVLFAIPGAFTPTCQAQHIPSFAANADKLKQKGADAVVCMAVNDPFVLAAQAEATGTTDTLDYLSDGNAEFTKAMGLELDGSGIGLGTRSHRFAMIVDDGVVREIFVEPDPSQMTVSSADNVLAHM